MTYCISDIHNDSTSLQRLLKKIHFSPSQDKLFILGDIFDRGVEPVELYTQIRQYGDAVTVVVGNHDDWFAEFIYDYFEGGQNRYFYSTFELMQHKMSDKELLEVAGWITNQPLYIRINVKGEEFLLAHGQTFCEMNSVQKEDILMGSHLDYKYLMNGIEGVTSVIGHTPTDSIRRWVEQEAIYPNRIWTNQKKNVYCIDCGNGLRGDRYYIGSRLAALCLETKEEFYV